MSCCLSILYFRHDGDIYFSDVFLKHPIRTNVSTARCKTVIDNKKFNLLTFFINGTTEPGQLQVDIKNPFITVTAKNKNSDSHWNTATAKSGETRRYLPPSPPSPDPSGKEPASLLTGNDCLILALL